ncbi:MAG TPA: energy transducer TonB [Pseudobdellovibrionaceae bacterium]|nr:energy transducer TonB [Pseudobdellovibrionaceae bacterium]
MRNSFLFSIFFVVLSLGMHVWFWQGVDYVAYYFPYERDSWMSIPKKNIVEIEYQEPKDKNIQMDEQKSIVKQVEVPENLKLEELKVKTDLLSEKVQRVLRETQAYLSGKTQNQVSKPSQSLQKKNENSKIKLFKDSLLSVDSNNPHFLSQAPPGPSAFGQLLKRDIPLGNLTVLNTDQYVYYSFYSRVDDLVYDRWQQKVQGLQFRLPIQVLKSTPEKGWTTQAEFLISPEGRLLKSMILKPSGVRELDMAAVSSFVETGIFPNPPIGMIQEDGLVHVNLSFTVRYSPTIVGEK